MASPDTKARHRHRATGAGSPARVKAALFAAGEKTEVPTPVVFEVRRKTLRTLSGKADLVTRLMERVGAAVEKSRLTGGPVSFKVEVDRRGTPTFTPLPGEDWGGSAEPESRDVARDLDASLETARERGRLRVADILSGEDMLSADEFATLLGTTRVTVNAKRRNNQVLGLEGAKRGYRFPEWQVDDDGKPFPALPGIFERLGGNAWAVYRFLVQQHPELNGLTGRDALRRGKTTEVLDVAEGVAGGTFS